MKMGHEPIILIGGALVFIMPIMGECALMVYISLTVGDRALHCNTDVDYKYLQCLDDRLIWWGCYFWHCKFVEHSQMAVAVAFSLSVQ